MDYDATHTLWLPNIYQLSGYMLLSIFSQIFNVELIIFICMFEYTNLSNVISLGKYQLQMP